MIEVGPDQSSEIRIGSARACDPFRVPKISL